jgi:phospholipid transport system substrate-binding protein
MSAKTILGWAALALLVVAWVAGNMTASRRPDILVGEISADVIGAATEADAAERPGSSYLVLIDKKVMPFVNSQRIAASALGEYWQQATPTQQRRLQHQIKILIMRECSQALLELRGRTVSLQSTLGSMEEDREVIVRTELAGPGQVLRLDYRVERRLSGWQIGDIRFRDVWLVDAYRRAFAQEIAATGLDGLIETLSAWNQDIDGLLESDSSLPEWRALGREHSTEATHPFAH